MRTSLYAILPLAALASPALADDCVDASSTVTLQVHIEQLQTAYGDMDDDAFATSVVEIDRALDCLGDPLTRNLIADIHRTQGLRFFVEQRSEQAKLAFAAARMIQPSYQFPEALIPIGNPVLDIYEAIPLSLASSAPIETPEGTYWQIDGRASAERPGTFPTVAQLFDDQGSLLLTSYLWPGDPMPEWGTSAPDVPVTPAEPAARGRWSAAGIGLLAGSGLSLVGSGLFYRMAVEDRALYDDPSNSIGELNQLRRAVNSQVLLSSGMGAAALGLGIAGGVVVR